MSVCVCFYGLKISYYWCNFTFGVPFFFSQTGDLMWLLQSNKLTFRSDEGDSPLLRICPMSDHHKTPTHATGSAVQNHNPTQSGVIIGRDLAAARCTFICLSFASLQCLRLSRVGLRAAGANIDRCYIMST